MAGDSIEATPEQVGTMGVFIRSDDKILGLTAGHVIISVDPGSNVIQPALGDFKEYVKYVKRQVEASEKDVLLAMPQNVER